MKSLKTVRYEDVEQFSEPDFFRIPSISENIDEIAIATRCAMSRRRKGNAALHAAEPLLGPRAADLESAD